MPTLTVHNAEIRTATVQVQTLTISDRQVTQAVFRQLQARELVNPGGRLNGKPWGWVNYHPDKCDKDEAHRHVVWQHGTDLFRARVNLNVTYPRWFEAEAAAAWVDAKVREEAITTLTCRDARDELFPELFMGLPVRMFMGASAQEIVRLRKRIRAIQREIAAHGPGHLVKASDIKLNFQPSESRPMSGLSAARAAAAAAARAAASRVTAREALTDLEGQLGTAVAALPATSLAAAEAALIAEVQAELDRRRRHSDIRAELADLPHLFIAAG